MPRKPPMPAAMLDALQPLVDQALAEAIAERNLSAVDPLTRLLGDPDLAPVWQHIRMGESDPGQRAALTAHYREARRAHINKKAQKDTPE